MKWTEKICKYLLCVGLPMIIIMIKLEELHMLWY